MGARVLHLGLTISAAIGSLTTIAKYGLGVGGPVTVYALDFQSARSWACPNSVCVFSSIASGLIRVQLGSVNLLNKKAYLDLTSMQKNGLV